MSRRGLLSRLKKQKESLQPKRVAPKGYHYMSDGTLMSDYEHELLFGNPDFLPFELRKRTTIIPTISTIASDVQFKIIHGIIINLGDINTNGEARDFSVLGDDGARFSLQVFDTVSGGKFYNFNDSTWTTAENILQNQVIRGGSYKGSIRFDAPSKLHNYEIRLIAIPSGCDPTRHMSFTPAYFGDGTIDFNNSIGSDSAVLIKKINSQLGSQSILTLSCISPSLGDSGEVNVDMTPDVASTAAADTINLSTGESLSKYSFSITLTSGSGKSFAILKTPTIDDLCALRTVDIASAALAIDGEDVSSSTYYRWPVTDDGETTGGGVAGLQEGMVLDPSSTTGGNVTAGSIISNYSTTISETRVTSDGCGESIANITKTDVAVPSVQTTGEPTLTRGVTTSQAGNLIFSKQQADALKSDQSVRIIGYGRDHIKSMTFGTDVKLSNVEVELTEISTTINDASATGSASLNDFDVAAVTGIMDDVSVLEAVNVTKTAAKPKVSAISSSNITVTPGGHYLQNGQTVKFLNASNVVTITGDIEVVKMGVRSATLYFDVERFLMSK